jgi:hypothetical protein
MPPLRDFLYLDTAKLYSFLSQIHGGLISDITDTIKQQGGLSAGIEVGLPPFGGKVGVAKDKGSERQQAMQLTDPAYFSALYQSLKKESQVKDITNSSLESQHELVEGEFVELESVAEPPVTENWISRVRALVDFVDRNLKLFTQTQSKDKRRNVQSLTKQQMGLFKDMVGFLEDYIRISRKDPGKQYIRLAREGQIYNVWCGLLPDYISAPLEVALPAEVRVFGRIERVLTEGEVIKIVDFSQFNQPGNIVKLLEALNALGPLIGQKAISETDLQAQYPDVFVTPVAIYR